MFIGNSADVKHEKMKNPELFHRTVGILVKAYLNNTLEHGNCCACAVGNLVAESCGLKIINRDGKLIWNNGLESGEVAWWHGRGGKNHTLVGEFNADTLIGQTKHEIESTGYSPKEFFMIEKVFEATSPNYEKDESGYLGLMAVVDYLIEIHKGTNKEAEQAKELFTLTE